MNTRISDVSPPELRDNTFLLFKPPSYGTSLWQPQHSSQGLCLAPPHSWNIFSSKNYISWFLISLSCFSSKPFSGYLTKNECSLLCVSLSCLPTSTVILIWCFHIRPNVSSLPSLLYIYSLKHMFCILDLFTFCYTHYNVRSKKAKNFWCRGSCLVLNSQHSCIEQSLNKC